MDSDKVLVPGALEQEAASIIERCARLIQQGVTFCVSTKRTVLTLPDDTPEAALVRSVAIRDALQSCVGKLPVTPAFAVAKGGITSSDVGVKALRVQCARVLGQIRPGIPVWQTGPESLFPGTPYVIFPGNVGEISNLREAIEILLGQAVQRAAQFTLHKNHGLRYFSSQAVVLFVFFITPGAPGAVSCGRTPVYFFFPLEPGFCFHNLPSAEARYRQ